MFQWVENEETEEDDEGNKTTTYSITEEWRTHVVNTNNFHSSSSKGSTQYTNPQEMRFENFSVEAQSIELGAFVLSKEIVDLITDAWYEPLVDHSLEDIPDVELRQEAERIDHGFYFGSHPPRIGDHRVTFRIIHEQPVSLIAQQIPPNTFQTFVSSSRHHHGGSILLFQQGEKEALEMFQQEQKQVSIRTNVFRCLGIFLLFVGFLCVFRWISVFLWYIPLIGESLAYATDSVVTVVAFALALLLGSITIALSWIFQRICILCCCCCCCCERGGSVNKEVQWGTLARKRPLRSTTTNM